MPGGGILNSRKSPFKQWPGLRRRPIRSRAGEQKWDGMLRFFGGIPRESTVRRRACRSAGPEAGIGHNWTEMDTFWGVRLPGTIHHP